MFGNVQPNFDITTTPLFEKAVAWWEGYRPCAYTLEKHLARPGINIPDTAGQELAIEIASILKNMEKQ